jgi:chemotaxis family two-component system sensor kinase Cph1
MSITLASAVTSCDAEPIHIPGAIQPHGLLLVADAVTFEICHVAGDVETRLGVEHPFGMSLGALIGPQAANRVTTILHGSDARPNFLDQIRAASGEAFDVSAFVSGDLVCVELEPTDVQSGPTVVLLGRLETAVAALERVASLQALCEQAAIVFRDFTGFDRVMIYRFGENDAGRVLAEARRPGTRSFLNHHFPASDIPTQARALYVRNLVRSIPDASYRPVPLRPAWTLPQPFDMSDSTLRSVSPIHLQYLRNMGVCASASISIVRDGVLWGLIACHHETPWLLTYEVRAACRVLAGVLSRQIKARDDAETYRQRIRFRNVEDEVVKLLSREGMLGETMANQLPQLLKMMDADGVAVLRGKDLITSGIHPQPGEIRQLATWLLHRPGNAVLASSALSEIYPDAAAFTSSGSGILSVVLSAEQPWLLIWFRAEQVEVVNWAGNPHKSIEVGPGETLSPRTSFEAWAETVRERSWRWSLVEVEAVRRLRRALLDLRQTGRLTELNVQLTRLLQEQTLLVEQKDYLIGEVNHRVQNSLQLVSSFLSVQGRGAASPEVRTTLAEARHRITAIALVHRRLYSGDETRTVDGARYIEDLCTDTLASMGEGWAAHLEMDLAPVLIPTDKAVTLGLVLTELFININKYAYGGAAGPIEVRLYEARADFVLEIADQGCGNVSTHCGFGSRMIDGLVAQFGGRITRVDNGPGLRVVLTAPV